jgi:tetratricopeptide (TPR) repeat protein
VLAGRQAQAKFANVVAAELYERALTAAEHVPELDPRDVAEVCEALGDVCERFARFDRAAAAYERAEALLADDPLSRARLLLKQGDLRERGGEYPEALDWYRRGLELVGGRDDPAALSCRARLELGRAGVLYRLASYEEAITWAREATGHAERAGDPATLAHGYHVLAACHSDLGSREGVPYLERALALYEELGDVSGQGSVLNYLGIDAYYQGGWDEALAFYARAREAKERSGDIIGAAIQKNNEAEILSDQGRLDEAGAAFAEALRTFRAAGYRWGVGVQQSNLGRVDARRGDFEDAHGLLEESRALLRELGADRYAAEADARLAECLVLEGRYADALELALATRESSGSLSVGGLQALLERVIGYALHQGRRADEARPHLLASLELARELDAEYEAALTLKAIADTRCPYDGDAAAESRAILGRLGVVAVPSPPLP